MLIGRVYRIYQRFADMQVAFALPGASLRDASGSEICRVEHIAVRRNRLHVSGVARPGRLEIAINRTRQSLDLAAPPGEMAAFAVDFPLEVGPIEIVAQADSGPVHLRLPGVRAGRVAWARRWQAVRFVRALVELAPEIYRWKWRGDLGGREVVKERLGLVLRPEAGALPAALLPDSQPTAPPARQATLVMPVFNGMTVLPEALDRIARHSGADWRLILVEDHSTDAAVLPFLEEWCAAEERSGRVTLLRTERNTGFVGAVNLALERAEAWPEDPVVLVNSDALVPSGWLPRLLAPLSDPSVASVTPMSNDAEIFSVPTLCHRSDLVPGAVDRIDAVAARLDPAVASVAAPTGVGFCMALAPRFLSQVPRFDTVFGRGYGEENDWCQRTIALGGRHLGIGNLFVEHRGGVSFGNADKQRLLERNLAELARRHPGYEGQVQDFVQHDPMAGARLALGLAWAGAQLDAAVPVYLAHALGGGAEMDLERRMAVDVAGVGAAVILRVGLRLRWQIELHTPAGATRCLTDDDAQMMALLTLLPRRRVVYSCGVGDRDGLRLPEFLLRLAEGGAQRLEVLIHDYFPISPSYTLLGQDGAYHGVPLAGGPLAADPAHQAARPNGLPAASLGEWQEAWGRLLQAAHRITVFSEASRALLTTVYPAVAPAVEVVAHDLIAVPARIAPIGRAGVIGVLGNIGMQKGADFLSRLSRDLARSGEGRIVVIGYMDPSYPLAAPSQVHGAYEMRDLPGLVERYGIGCWLIPSIWPETFSFTTHEALATGLPVYAFDLGAQGEAVARAVAAGAPGGVLPLPSGTGPLDPALVQRLIGHTGDAR